MLGSSVFRGPSDSSLANMTWTPHLMLVPCGWHLAMQCVRPLACNVQTHLLRASFLM